MSAKRKPARVARTGLENVSCLAASDTSRHTIAFSAGQPHQPSAQLAARHLVDDMIAHGAVFEILRRDAREVSFVYKLRPNASDADRARCRHIVADVKDTGAISQFIAAIVELEEARR